MVALKIRSADDIVKACLLSLGFSEAQCRNHLFRIRKRLPEGEDDILRALNDEMAADGRKIFKNCRPDTDFAALYKFCFLQAGGARKWPADFLADNISSTFRRSMRQQYLATSPEITLSSMEPQKIEPVIRLRWWHRFFRNWHRYFKSDKQK